MKNREYRAVLTLILMMSLAAGSMRTPSSDVYAKESKKESVSVVSKTAAAKTAATKEGAEAKKEETVYAKVDGSGKIMSVTVSDQLKNVSSEKEIRDVSDLANIENVKGDEEFKQLGNSLVWSGDSKDICYQGTASKELPVGIHVTYELDGKEIGAEELKGKSGHLVIHYEYENKTSDQNQAYTPFLMVTGLMLDTDRFTGVTIDNGKVISDGDRNIALGMGIPKMKEVLGVEEIDIPDEFTVEADVTDYETIEAVTVATNDLFSQIDTDKFESLEELTDSMKELQNASDQLVSGSGELKKGLDTLLSSSGTLTDGIGQLANGSNTLKNGTDTLAGGTNALNIGAAQVADGAANAAKSTAHQLLPGVQELDAGVSGMQKELYSSIPDLANGVTTLHNGVSQAASTAAALDAGVDQAAAGAAELKNGINEIAGNTQNLTGAARYVADYLSNGTTATADITVQADNSNAIGMLENLKAQAPDYSDEIQSVINELSASAVQTESVTVTVPADATAAQYANTVAEGLGGISGALSDGGTIGAGMANLQGTLTSTEGAAVKAASAGLNAAFNTNTQGSISLKDGMASLNSKVNGQGGLVEQLNSGVSQLKAGTGILLNGEDGKGGVTALSKGMNTLSNGAGSVAAGATELSSGAKELSNGAGTLALGIGSLQSGSGALIEGVQKLDDGAGTLSDGMITFNEDGIKKLVRAFDGDIDGMLNKLNDMLDASREYKNFAGISDEMDGEVKFVFVTEK